jgi:hypothetical protein
MNEDLDAAKRALGEGLRVEIDNAFPIDVGPTPEGHRTSGPADQGRPFALRIYDDSKAHPVVYSTTVDPSTALELIEAGAKYVGVPAYAPVA